VTAQPDSAVGFWLRYVAAQGGLAEADGETHLAVLPEAVRAESGFGELVHVTGEPDIAREGDAVLLGPGHPALSAIAYWPSATSAHSPSTVPGRVHRMPRRCSSGLATSSRSTTGESSRPARPFPPPARCCGSAPW
jgi:hypothetical protein